MNADGVTAHFSASLGHHNYAILDNALLKE